MSIMIDLETMGLAPYGAIVQIGVCSFDEVGIVDTFYSEVSLIDSVSAGMKVDPSTILWWLSQPEEVRNWVKDNEKKSTLRVALLGLSSFFKDLRSTNPNEKLEVWANSPSFDCSILRTAYGLVKLECPFTFREEMCCRTAKNLFKDVTHDFKGVKHNALDDAKNQALNLIKLGVI
jgi:3' exoribonuclease, RNase T-like